MVSFPNTGIISVFSPSLSNYNSDFSSMIEAVQLWEYITPYETTPCEFMVFRVGTFTKCQRHLPIQRQLLNVPLPDRTAFASIAL